MTETNSYIAIDLKSFYASVECVDRGLDPMNTYLVVADESRTEKTICLAVSPALKAHGIPGRPRLFEVEQRVKEVNWERAMGCPSGKLKGKTAASRLLKQRIDYGIDYYRAAPRMARYIEVSKRIYGIYMKYIAPQDIHVYSIDEVFIYATPYLRTYGMTPKQLAMKIVGEILYETGITATVGIGSNLYLSKIAMDIVAKHLEADSDGVRLAELDEGSYRRLLWGHKPIDDFWRVGRGYRKKLESVGLFTMGDIARCSLGSKKDFHNEELLYKIFGINAELLIDHAWGYEPCTIADIKGYRPSNNSVCSGQVLQDAYSFKAGRIVIAEMIDGLALDLLSKNLLTDQIVLTVGYDVENILDPIRVDKYKGDIVKDAYGRLIPKAAHGTTNMDEHTNSSQLLLNKTLELFDRIVNKDLLIRRMNISANHILTESNYKRRVKSVMSEQISIFDVECKDAKVNSKVVLLHTRSEEKDANKVDDRNQGNPPKRDREIQEAFIKIRNKFGKNSILKGTSYQEGATARDRNKQIGGHKA